MGKWCIVCCRFAGVGFRNKLGKKDLYAKQYFQITITAVCHVSCPIWSWSPPATSVGAAHLQASSSLTASSNEGRFAEFMGAALPQRPAPVGQFKTTPHCEQWLILTHRAATETKLISLPLCPAAFYICVGNTVRHGPHPDRKAYPSQFPASAGTSTGAEERR